jgi:hypothetical protein
VFIVHNGIIIHLNNKRDDSRKRATVNTGYKYEKNTKWVIQQ